MKSLLLLEQTPPPKVVTKEMLISLQIAPRNGLKYQLQVVERSLAILSQGV